jgi:diguanylate cyclase (GGDEF)-like protein
MNTKSASLLSKIARNRRVNEVMSGDAFDPSRAIALCKTYEGLKLGALWITDAEGRLSYLSESAAAKLATDGNYAGTAICDIFSSEEATGSAARSLRLTLARKSSFERLVVYSGPEEKPVWWSISGEAQFDSMGEFCGFHGFCTDITQDRQAAEENSQLAMHDPLTGLINRRRMTNLLERTLAAFRGQQRACATMMIDLDRFKQVNDTLGHSTGDALLKQVAERLLTIVGDRSKVCRLGGDEFQVILADEDDRGKLGDLAERIISMVSQPYRVDGARCLIGASVGIAISPHDGDDLDELVRNADLALYAAKHGGRGRFRFFSRELLEAAEERRVLEEDLHDALAHGELELHYQPIVESKTNRVSGAEALIRWKHPEKGMISPANFIPIAEESNLIRRIGEWILRKGCEDAAKWPVPLRIAVNVSPVQFIDPSFPSLVANALASSGLTPGRLELEITEGVFLAEGAATEATFKALKNLGVRLALDDFGTGYSSLAYLKSAPFDKIKIDQSFVQGATKEGSRSKAIITAIVSMASALDMETTAEGIETFDQLNMIRERGVSHIQGYIYSKAMSNDEFVEKSTQAEWGIEPKGYAKQRLERISMYRKIGAIHEDHYYTVVMRNLSATGALIEGLVDVPTGTQFVLDFGDGQLQIAQVIRSHGAQQGVAFECPLVSDGNGGLCTRTRISQYLLATAGLPEFGETSGPKSVVGGSSGKISIPNFISSKDLRSIVSTGNQR